MGEPSCELSTGAGEPGAIMAGPYIRNAGPSLPTPPILDHVIGVTDNVTWSGLERILHEIRASSVGDG
jgi:hypothetical protein